MTGSGVVPAPGETVDVPCPVCDGQGVFTSTRAKCRTCDGEGSYQATVAEYDGGPVFDHLTEAHATLDDWVGGHYRAGTIHPKVAPGDIRFVHPCRVGPPPMPFTADTLAEQIVNHWTTEAEDYETPDDLERAIFLFVAAVNTHRLIAGDIWHPVDDQVIAHQFTNPRSNP